MSMKKKNMMKSLFSILLLIFAVSANADTYFKIEVGKDTNDFDEVALFSDSALNDNFKQISAGYKINNNFAIEASYQRFEINGIQEFLLPSDVWSQQKKEKKQSWFSTLTADRLNLKSLYLRNFGNELQLHTGIGLTVTQYDFESNTQREIPISEEDGIITASPSANRSELKVGAVANIGIDYPVWENVTLGADANVSVDNVTSTLQFIGTVGYHF